MTCGWKHKNPLELESDSPTNSEAESRSEMEVGRALPQEWWHSATAGPPSSRPSVEIPRGAGTLSDWEQEYRPSFV